MLKFIEKDILTISEGIICHQVNSLGVMGSGIALAIKQKFPMVYTDYTIKCKAHNKREEVLLGECQLIKISDKLSIANIFGQLGYGRARICYTNYDAVTKAFITLASLADKRQVYIPYLIGCVRGGGNWATYEEIIETYIPTAIVCKMPGVLNV